MYATNKQINHLRIKRHLSIVAHSPDYVELRSGVWNPISYTLDDESKKGSLLNLIQTLDGSLSTAEIATKFNLSNIEIEHMLDQLQQLGVLETSATNALDLYLDNVIPHMRASIKNEIISQAPISIIGDDELANPLYNLLVRSIDASRISVIDEDDPLMTLLSASNDNWLHDGLLCEQMLMNYSSWKNHFFILIQKHVNPILSSKFNRIAHELKIPWIHAAIDGPFLLIGPTFHTNGGCYDCFEMRMMMNLREHNSYQKYKKALIQNKLVYNKVFSVEPALIGLLTSHIALEALNFYLTQCNFTKGKLLSIYLPTMEMTFNEVLQHGSCPTCGASQWREGYQSYFDIHSLLKN